jgi:hypothetical protein
MCLTADSESGDIYGPKDDMALELKWVTHNSMGWFDGFEHHVAVNQSQVAAAVNEALSKYLGWDVYHHKGNGV